LINQQVDVFINIKNGARQHACTGHYADRRMSGLPVAEIIFAIVMLLAPADIIAPGALNDNCKSKVAENNCFLIF